MSALFYSLLSVFLISLISLLGTIVFFVKEKYLKTVLLFFISFSAGSLMGGAFFHLLPEALAQNQDSVLIFIYALAGFCLFFVLERVFRWRHCHEGVCHTHEHLGWLSLFGDGLHNAIDGLVIVSAFSIGPALGIPVTLSIIFHEIPQELGDFGVLLYAGFSKAKAALYNFISAGFAFLGVFAGYFLLTKIDHISLFLLPFAAGGFIYISASDLIPEIHQENDTYKSLASFLVFFAALVLMLLLKFFGAE